MAPSQGGGSGQEGNPFMTFLPLILIIVVFYLFMIRPQVKRQKELRNFRQNLQKGDKVVTSGGIYGNVTNIDEQTVNIDIGSNIIIKVDKNSILRDPSDMAQQRR